MLIAHVHVEVTADCIEPFRQATVENARESLQEPGIVRFDVVQSVESPTSFVLVEVYRSPADQRAHKETRHFHQWVETVESMMAAPRSARLFTSVHPDEESWS